MPDQLSDASAMTSEGATTPADSPTAAQKNKSLTLLIALGALAIIAGVVVALVAFVFSSPANDSTAPSSPTASTTTNSSAATTSTAAKEPASAVANSEVFTFRDIFKPLLSKPASATASTAATLSTTSSATAAASGTSTPGTLYLTDISSENGAYKGTFVLNGKTYTLGNGQRVGTSPWQVVSVSSASAVMLYGDTRVTVTVGQGITK